MENDQKFKRPFGKVARNKEDAWKLQESYPHSPHAWIQWKGTSVCMDVHCACGNMTHVDDEYCYHIECGHCGRVYFCNGHIELIELQEIPPDFIVKTEIDDEH